VVEGRTPMARRRRPSRSKLALRWLGLAVLLAIALGYVQPLRAYLDARDQVAVRSAELAVLEREREHLARRLELTGTDAFIEREARRLGLVRPGERLFIVKGVDRSKRTQIP
jgi:cell division protein FtsB